MKAGSALVESCRVYIKPQKLCSTLLSLFHLCLTVGTIRSSCSSPLTKELHGLALSVSYLESPAVQPCALFCSLLCSSVFFKLANPGLFLFIFVLFITISIQIEKSIDGAWELNPGPQVGSADETMEPWRPPQTSV